MIEPAHQIASNLDRLKVIRHGFFGRMGGVSEGLYESLNLGLGSGDDARNIRENRSRVCHTLQAEQLLSCFQVHGADVIRVTEAWSTRPRADAMVTNQSGLALCILTADCVPILLADPQAGVIGAAHAGWKGALAGVVERTVQAMQDLGAAPETTYAAIGPAIQQDSYEVGPEFRDKWIEAQAWTERLFRPGNGDRLHFDLIGYVHATLKRAGIIDIETIKHDTCTRADMYFSNRRRNQLKQADYGRNGSVIVLD